jgi:hypothetical protein
MWRRLPRSALLVVGGAASLLLGAAACGNGSIGEEGRQHPDPAQHVPKGEPSVSVAADGMVTEIYPDGTVIVRQPDGTVIQTNPNGDVVVTGPNGDSSGDHQAGTKADPTTIITSEEALASVLPGGIIPWSPTDNPDFDREASIAAFEKTVYPLLRANCSTCHSSDNMGQLPLHADVTLERAHDDALGYVNLRQVATSRLISRLSVDTHNCWSECSTDAGVIQAEMQRWAELLGPDGIPDVDIPEYPAEVSEEVVLEWIENDRASLAPEDAEYTRYASLHVLLNWGATPDDMNTARAGLSKALNSTARYAPAIVNPEAVNEYGIVYRFDVRAYWGYARNRPSFSPKSEPVPGRCLSGGGFGYGAPGEVEVRPDCGLEIWERITKGNIAVAPDDMTWIKLGSPANNLGFKAEYVEAAQLVYTLSRPDVYNDVMQIPGIASALERELGVDRSKTYQFMTVNDAITIGERLMWRAPIADGYYWKSVDQFSTTPFVFYERPIPTFTDEQKSQIITTPMVTGESGPVASSEYTGETGAQAQTSEVIFSLPNQLQGYAIFGSGNQRRADAFTIVVLDPRRLHEMPGVQRAIDLNSTLAALGVKTRLLNGASCMGCHSAGVNRAPDDMRPYIAANRSGSWTRHATTADVEALYPGTEAMVPIIEADRRFFLAAQQEIAEAMILGTSDKSLYFEPQLYLFEAAQRIYGYLNTVSN